MRVLSDGAQPVAAAPLPEGACHVCGEEEETDDDLLLHCDACRVYVHQACYGVADAPDGRTWLCDFCKAGAPGLGHDVWRLKSKCAHATKCNLHAYMFVPCYPRTECRLALHQRQPLASVSQILSVRLRRVETATGVRAVSGGRGRPEGHQLRQVVPHDLRAVVPGPHRTQRRPAGGPQRGATFIIAPTCNLTCGTLPQTLFKILLLLRSIIAAPLLHSLGCFILRRHLINVCAAWVITLCAKQW